MNFVDKIGQKITCGDYVRIVNSDKIGLNGRIARVVYYQDSLNENKIKVDFDDLWQDYFTSNQIIKTEDSGNDKLKDFIYKLWRSGLYQSKFDIMKFLADNYPVFGEDNIIYSTIDVFDNLNKYDNKDS